MLAVLHISDLHRDPNNRVKNNALLLSLTSDQHRYVCEEPPVQMPTIIVVSGDIIQGVKHDDPDLDKSLKAQYEEAKQFLTALAARFLNGNKERIVIVPGNHDVSAHEFYRSIKPVDLTSGSKSSKEQKRQIMQSMFQGNSTIRWSWDDLSFYEIHDKEAYRRRFSAFSEFYSDFYEGKRTYSLDEDKQFDIFNFSDEGIVFAGFNSCFNNDLFNRSGAIHTDCIIAAADELSSVRFQDSLKIAVWHHNTSGPPLNSDYMDSSILQSLMDKGFCAGMHGHQHKAQIIDSEFEFGNDRKFITFSAGTLCGGPNALTSGRARSYNVIEFNPEIPNCRLHLRQMNNNQFDDPIWSHGFIPRTSSTFVDISLSPPPNNINTSRAYEIYAHIDELIIKKDYSTAITLLGKMDESEFKRSMLMDCYKNANMQPELIELINPPISVQEVIYLADVLWTTGDRDTLKKMLQLPYVMDHSDVSVVEIRNKYLPRLN